MALTKSGFKDQHWSHLEEGTNREERRREEEEEEEKRKKKRSQDQANKVWKLTLIMNSMRLCMNFYAWLVSSCPQTWGFARVSS